MTIIDPTSAQVLACPTDANDTDTSTVGGWLLAQLGELWHEGHHRLRDDGPVAKALIRAGYVEGEIDGDGCIDRYDDKRADRLIAEAIMSLYPDGENGPVVTRKPSDLWRAVLVNIYGIPLDIDTLEFDWVTPVIRVVRRSAAMAAPGAEFDPADLAHRYEDFIDADDFRARWQHALVIAAGLNAAEATR